MTQHAPLVDGSDGLGQQLQSGDTIGPVKFTGVVPITVQNYAASRSGNLGIAGRTVPIAPLDVGGVIVCNPGELHLL